MTKKRKIYVVGPSKGYARWIDCEVVNNFNDADIIMFTGGEDVSPVIYREPANIRTYSNENRDIYEMGFFNRAVTEKKHILGICRGAQFLCAMSGGRLVQHQENPHHIHQITTSEGHSIPITSTHHQAMYPYDMKEEHYEVLAYTNNISKIHQDGHGKEISDTPFNEVEICYFPVTKALGIQGHPENMDIRSDGVKYFQQLLTKFLDNKIDCK